MRPSESLRPRRLVLVVDDDPGIREALGMILGDAYDVLFAADGPPVPQLVEQYFPDLVLLDLGLPTMSGLEILPTVRAIAPDVPVVVVTITSATDAVVQAMRLGATDYVVKPFREDDILSKVGAALSAQSNGPHAFPSEEPAPGERPDGKPRRRCLLVVGHPGTAGTLEVVLDRYVSTDIAADGLGALRAIGVAVPDCVVCDDAAWTRDGATFVRALRVRHPNLYVVRMTGEREPIDPGGPGGLIDTVVPQCAGVGEAVRRILAFCLPRGLSAHRAELPSRYVSAAMEYLRYRYAEELTVEGIARAAGLTRGHLTERFRAELGLSLSQFVLRLRIQVAKSLLRAHVAKLEEVAALSGFRDPSHLSRVFLAQTGQRPGAYRRQFA
jgi:CheY-like chemotaxis protein